MSKFKTSIPVDVDAVRRMLPQGHFFHRVEWDPKTNTVNLVWEHDRLLTGRDFPVDVPVSALRGETDPPPGIRDLTRKPEEPTAPAGQAASNPLPGPHPEAEAPAAAVPAAESPVPTAPAKPVARRGRRR